jgi:hypothetical protein
MKKTLALTVLSLASIAACDPPRNRTDAGTPPIDALVVRDDAFVEPGADASLDAGMVAMPDAFVPPMTDAAMPDAFTPMTDAFAPMADAFAPMADAFSADAFVAADAAFAATPCEQIAAVRATNGSLAPAYPVRGAVVSYVMPVLPAGATDPRGVFVQCPGAAGPALFLAISPDDTTSFPTAPRVGDVVSFDVTVTADTTTSGGTGDQHRVTAITGWSVTGSGSITAQDVGAVALPAMIDAYESEIVSMDATLASASTAAGVGFTSFQITTTGVPTATADQRFRLPIDVATTLGLVAGCQIRLTGTPLWRFTTAAQPSAWQASEITVLSCPSGCTPATHLVINEIDYDQPGADSAEYVEIHNPTASAIDLSGMVLVAVNGLSGGPVEYGRVSLSGSLAANGFLLVTAMGSTVAGATLSFPEAMQNGPDGMLLLGPGNVVVDAAMYEGAIASVTLTGGTVVTIAESASIGSDTGAGSLARTPNACDRDTPATDWAGHAGTPGAAN